MNKTTTLLAGTGLLLGLSAAACRSHGDAARAEAAAPATVRVHAMKPAAIEDSFEAGGVVQARTSATLTSRILAPVREVRVAPGDRVRAGQVLILLDGREPGAQARSAGAAARAAEERAVAARADEAAAQASLALARATYARIASLEAKRSATRHELDEATAALRAGEAGAASAAARAQEATSNVESARAASDAASTTASFTRITAPFDGIVTEKLVEPGNMAAPGTPLARVEDTRAFRLDVRIDESRVSTIAPGSGANVLIESGSGAAAVVEGRVSEIARAVDADSRAFLVKIALPDAAGIRSGMFGRARFAGGSRQALTVPAGAVIRRGQVMSVFVADKGVARLRLVRLRGREVLAGLHPGERVVVDPPAGLLDGTPIKEEGR
jgi:RND family efflux transporter MFP subunit